ncbi:MAG: hypothetical protein ABI273_09870, partial [Lacunisphaera sp.]
MNPPQILRRIVLAPTALATVHRQPLGRTTKPPAAEYSTVQVISAADSPEVNVPGANSGSLDVIPPTHPAVMESTLKPQGMKRRLKLSILLLVGMFAAVSTSLAAEVRHIENFNREWTFKLGDVAGAEAPNFDDSAWDHIGLPHSFSTPYFAATNSFYVGYGWYRKR